MFNVKDFGAVGNGTTDDTTAIQNAINAASLNNTGPGGIVWVPSGTYLHTASFKVGVGGSRGVQIIGAGVGSSAQQTTTFLTAASAPTIDSFVVDADPGGGISFRDFFINRAGAPTAGVAFKLLSGQNITINNVVGNNLWDAIQAGKTASNVCNQYFVTNSTFQGIANYGVHVVGYLGNFDISNVLFNGTGNTTCTFFLFAPGAAGDTLDPLYLSNIDVEGFAYGFRYTNGLGALGDSFITNSIICDNATQGPAFWFEGGASSGAINRLTISNSWGTSTNNSRAALHIAGGQSYSVDDLKIIGCDWSGINAECIHIRNGVRNITLVGNNVYGSSGSWGVRIGADAGLPAKNILISGNRIGDVFGTPNYSGILLSPAVGSFLDKVTISGNDLTGNSNNPLTIDQSLAGAGSITNCLIEGNNMGAGISVVGPLINNTNLLRNNMGSNAGLLPTPAGIVSGTAVANPYPYVVRVSCSGGTGLLPTSYPTDYQKKRRTSPPRLGGSPRAQIPLLRRTDCRRPTPGRDRYPSR